MKKDKTKLEREMAVSQKWGDKVTRAGFTIIPSHLLTINAFLPKYKKLSSTELLILFQLIGSWWDAAKFPFPSKATLAERVGLKSTRQVQRALTKLEDKGFIKREARFQKGRGRLSNRYNLDGTVTIVSQLIDNHPSIFKSSKAADSTDKNEAPAT